MLGHECIYITEEMHYQSPLLGQWTGVRDADIEATEAL